MTSQPQRSAGPAHPVAHPNTVHTLPFLGELEGLRGLAAFAVMLTHVGFLSGLTGGQQFAGLLARLDIGVAVFFVLSGFLLFRPHVRSMVHGLPRPGVRVYAVRRFARLVPALLVCLAGTLVLVPDARHAPWQAWLANLLQVQAWRIEWDLPGLAQLWSLSTEVAFYLALPLLAWVIARRTPSDRPMRILLLLVPFGLLSWGTRIAHDAGLLADGWHWSRTLPLMLDWFLIGMALAVVASGAPAQSTVHAVLRHAGTAGLVVAASLFWVLTTWVAGPYLLDPPLPWQAWVKHLGYGIVAGLLVLPSALGAVTPVTPMLRSRVITFMGKISYGFFLWHLPVIFWVRPRLGHSFFDGGFWITVVTTTAMTTVLATASFYLLESPIMNRVRHALPRDR